MINSIVSGYQIPCILLKGHDVLNTPDNSLETNGLNNRCRGCNEEKQKTMLVEGLLKSVVIDDF